MLRVNPDAETAEIKKNYRKLSKKYHPDISDEENAEEKFKEIATAYEVLSSEESRKKYDQELNSNYRNRTQGSSHNKRKTRKKRTTFSKGDFENFEGKFKDFFGFDPQTKEKVKKEKSEDEMNTDDLFNSFFGVDK
ncbi:MAG: DnaJ domain-containing protein [Bacillota bacterium]